MEEQEDARKAIVATIEQVARKKEQLAAVKKLRSFLKGKTLTPAVKNSVTKQLKLIVEGDYMLEPSEVFMSLMGRRTKRVALTDYQKKMFTAICEIVDKTPASGCNHELEIIPLLYGGGFTPTCTRPELFCPKCGLNVTIWTHTTPDDLEKTIGVRIPIELNRALKKWCEGTKRVLSSNLIAKEPMETYERSEKFRGDMSSLKVVNLELLEQNSGV
jgi:hypothetical protein